MSLVKSGLYANKAFFSLEDIQRLTQSVVFLADCIYVPASVSADPRLTDEAQSFIYSRLQEFHEIGAVSFWEIEGQTSFLRDSLLDQKHSLPIDRIISRDEYKTIYHEVIDRLTSCRSDFLGTEVAGSFDGITEIVLGKHTILTFALNSHLQTRSILLDPVTEANNSRFFERLLFKTKIAEQVVQEVSIGLHIPDLSLLDIKNIQECRELMPAFRDRLFDDIEAGQTHLQTDRSMAIKQIADAIVDRFLEHLHEKARQQSFFKAARTAAWSLAQMVLPKLITQDNSDRFFKWGSSAPPVTPELFLFRLRNVKKVSTK